MKNDSMVVEAELPQIREMVLANTLRIERNEQIINEMRKKEDKERQRQLEWQTYWEVSREEHDRAHREHQEDMRELRRLMREHSANVDADLKKHREELDAEIEVGELLRTIDYDYPNFHLTMHCYKCRLSVTGYRLREHEAAKWLAPNELQSVNWLPADEDLIEELSR